MVESVVSRMKSFWHKMSLWHSVPHGSVQPIPSFPAITLATGSGLKKPSRVVPKRGALIASNWVLLEGDKLCR